jgi:alpha-ketoglutarate-dependent taurine dioxygenase
MIEIPVEAVTPKLGAYVKLPGDTLLFPGVPDACLDLLNQYGVLIFPRICVSDEVQVAFSNQLGRMKPTRMSSDTLGIYPVTLDPNRAKFLDYIHSNEHWHMDGTTYAIPPKATNLKCEVPPSAGGDTEFANLYAAYEDLPAARKQQLEKLRVIHSAQAANSRFFANPSEEDLERWRRDGPPREQPLVWHQAHGRTSLVIGSTAECIVGMDAARSRALLDELLTWCTQPQYCYRHRWQQGDMVLWNNPGLLHRAHHYTAESGRLMHRTTIMGSEST